jgi:hypothetical protein
VRVQIMPIDPNFQKTKKNTGEEKNIAVWGLVDPPEKLGIRGTYVAVDWASARVVTYV